MKLWKVQLNTDFLVHLILIVVLDKALSELDMGGYRLSCSLFIAVRQDRMRGGRNKFGPMYKRDRALKQQALRQQQQLIATCHARFSGGMGMMGDQDIKPDPSMLHQLSSEGNVGYAMHSPPLSGMPSPGMPDSPPQDLSRLSNSGGASQALPTSTNSPSQVYTMPPNYHHSVVSAMRNQYSSSSHVNHHYNHHSPTQMSPLSPVAPPIVPIVPQLILDVKASMADENEIKQKLTSFVQNEFGHEDILQPSVLINMLCKLSDQLLFLMVEWARTSFFFKDLKVNIYLTYSRISLVLLFQIHDLQDEAGYIPQSNFISIGFISWFNHFVATVIKKTVQKEKISITDGKKLYFIDSKLESLVVNCMCSIQ